MTRRSRAARADAPVARAVAGESDFPELVHKDPRGRCRLCRMAEARVPEAHRAIVRRVHDYYREGLGVEAIRGRIEEAVAVLSLPVIDNQMVKRHRAHVSFDPAVLSVEVADAHAVLRPAALATVAAGRARERVERREGSVDDYFELWSLFERLKLHLDVLDTSGALDPPKSDEDAVGMGRRAYALLIWLKLVKETRSLLEAIARVRQGDRFTRQILQVHTRELAFGISAPLRDALVEMRNALEAGRPADALARIELFMGEEWGQMFERVQRETYAKTGAAFKVELH